LLSFWIGVFKTRWTCFLRTSNICIIFLLNCWLIVELMNSKKRRKDPWIPFQSYLSSGHDSVIWNTKLLSSIKYPALQTNLLIRLSNFYRFSFKESEKIRASFTLINNDRTVYVCVRQTDCELLNYLTVQSALFWIKGLGHLSLTANKYIHPFCAYKLGCKKLIILNLKNKILRKSKSAHLIEYELQILITCRFDPQSR
jgi:hypothetical protein